MASSSQSNHDAINLNVVPSAAPEVWHPYFLSLNSPVMVIDSVMLSGTIATTVVAGLLTPEDGRVLAGRTDPQTINDSMALIIQCVASVSNMGRHLHRYKAGGANLKLPPGPWKLPLIGNLHQLIGSGSLPHSSLRVLAEKHGPVLQLKLGEVLAVIISSPEAAREVLKTHELSFAQRPNFFVSEFLSYKFSIWRKCKEQDEFIFLVKEIIMLSSGFNVPDLFPSLKFIAVINGMKTALERVHQKMVNILQDIIDDHKMNMITNRTINDSSCKEDLFDVLLKLQESSELKFEITTKHIKAVTSDMYLAGGETSETTLEWAMSELLRNPKVMEKAQAEVRKVFEGKRKIEDTDILKLDYVKSVIKETLRLHPLATLWRDPEYWVNAECFQPERFRGSSVDFKGTDFEYLPFGAGRRMCPGTAFGIAIIELALSQLLYHFDWKLPNEIKPEELDMTENFGSTCKRMNDLYLIAIPRIPFLI
uniref:Uncharacterized protein n=1 Tax=Fagus sylvatica TaxID=28930 RepID=A0A2N9JBQ1_FAGSY